MLKDFVDATREKAPLVHNITNYVTVNDVANIILACGASPIMADDIEEVEEITALCAGLCINIGTLSARTIPAMLSAGKRAGELGHPVLLDPVGAGASRLRTDTALRILQEAKVSALRGNISELKALMGAAGTTQGVDAAASDRVTEDNLPESVAFAKHAAEQFGCIVAITGAIDLVADSMKCYVIRNGRAEMGRITGTGCQCSALVTSYLAASPEKPLEATAAAVAAMGIAGEIGWRHMQPGEGNASYRTHIIDAVYHLDGAVFEKEARYESC